MRKETITRDIYTFDELSDAAKERAREWYRSGTFDYEWWDGVYELANTAGAILGIDIDEIYFSGFWSQGDGACFTGRYQYRKGWKKALSAEFGGELLARLVTIGDELQAAQKAAFFTGTARIEHSGHYYHSGCMRFDCDIERGNFEDFEDSIQGALRGFADWIYRQLESEYEYLTSDESVDESILANEYEFSEDGAPA